jgi:hypothetical protein
LDLNFVIGMGKRKDRRLPAGRRVKLDLFAEPCGDASSQDEVNGGEDDSKSRAGLISSPSSSSGGFHQFSSKRLIYVKRT